jgi:tetratricopeptide (TPR) repeat protein
LVRLRRFLGSTFGLLALAYLVASISTVSHVLREIRTDGLVPPADHVSAGRTILATLLIAASRGLLLVPPLLAVCFGMAASTIRFGKRSARPWALVSSTALVLQCIPFVILVYFVPPHHMYGARPLVVINGVLLLIGVAGLVAFVPRASASNGLGAKVKAPRIAGDGTSVWADAVAWIVATLGYFALMTWWYRWAHAEGLPTARGFTPWGCLFLALFVSVAIHEAGHAIAGLMLGMKVRLFFVGPFQWRVRDGKWTFRLDLKKTFSGGGATGCVPTSPKWERADDICMIGAGPAASLALGFIASALALSARGEWYEPEWRFLVVLSSISLIGAVVNLLPLRPDALYSDGAQIFQLIKGGPWADLHRVLALVQSTLVTPLRPRDYDLAAIEKAEQSFPHGIHALLLRLYASSYFLDRGDFDRARDEFRQAEALFPDVESLVTGDLLTAFVFRSAFLCRDAQAARRWWERLEKAKPTHFGVDYWLAKASLMWVEGNTPEARSCSMKACELATRLPRSGAYDFDRSCCELLGAEIGTTGQAHHELTELAVCAAN